MIPLGLKLRLWLKNILCCYNCKSTCCIIEENETIINNYKKSSSNVSNVVKTEQIAV